MDYEPTRNTTERLGGLSQGRHGVHKPFKGNSSTPRSQSPLGTRFLADMLGHQVGWQHWQDGKPDEAQIGFLQDGYCAPDRNSLDELDQTKWPIGPNGQPRDPWQMTDLLPFIDETDTVFTFTTGTWGGRGALQKLEEAHRRRRIARHANDPIGDREKAKPIRRTKLCAGLQHHPMG